MGKKNKLLLVSLQEQKAAKLAQVLNNPTSRKILDYLTSHESVTETQLSKALNVPLPTIHYTLKQLVQGSLVTSDEFHYSSKGREVNHYSLANQYIIITPKSTYGFKEKLKTVLPVGLLALGITALIQYVSTPLSQQVVQETAQESVQAAAAPMMMKAADMAVTETAAVAPQLVTQSSVWNSIAFWFLLGTLISIALMLIVDYFRKK